MSDHILYTYRGEDRFYGVPKRSLTQADFDALTNAQKRDVIASTSYIEHTAKPADTPAVKADDKKEG